MLIGYARVSTVDQNVEPQQKALEAAGCDRIYTEKASGTNTQERPVLAELLDFVREGDTLIATRIDRLARSTSDMQAIVATLKRKKVALRCTEQPVDTSTAAGKLFFDMLTVFAEFETNLRRERQEEGIAAAKAKGLYKGRKRQLRREEIAARLQAGESQSMIAKSMGISRMSVYRVGQEGRVQSDMAASAHI